ncbi:MAG: GAF domain-containing protein [Hyphomicrobiales bacterium]|nr:GAF domain-containing protein [Hyphomicrobiales bacterium]
MADCTDDFSDVFQSLEDLARELVGHRLFTLMSVDKKMGEAARIFSNMPDAYPIFGKKPVTNTPWSKQVIDNHETFVANDISEIAAVFDDYELIQSLGCESVINVPIVIGAQVIGTINCLAEVEHYTSDRILASDALKLPGAACFLCHLFNNPLAGQKYNNHNIA